jgi:hypothetical protein
VTAITLTGCIFTTAADGGAGASIGIQIASTVDDTVNGVAITNTSITAPVALDIRGATNANVTGGTFIGTSATAAFKYGIDGSAGVKVTGTVSGATVSSTGDSHGLLIGAGTVGVIAQNNKITAGDNLIVVKECTGAQVRNNTLSGGTTSGIYFKAAVSASVTGNRITASAGVGIIVGVNIDTGNKCQGITLTNNRIAAARAADLFNWGDSGDDDGGGVCDYNIYGLRGTGDFGSVRSAVNIANLTELRAAWTGYDVAGNDVHSSMENIVEMRGHWAALVPDFGY